MPQQDFEYGMQIIILPSLGLFIIVVLILNLLYIYLVVHTKPHEVATNLFSYSKGVSVVCYENFLDGEAREVLVSYDYVYDILYQVIKDPFIFVDKIMGSNSLPFMKILRLLYK